jgi:hypothetical protein
VSSGSLFEPDRKFRGLPAAAFEVFSIPEKERRRRAILDGFHPALEALGEDLVEGLAAPGEPPLHAHLPQLNWPKTYQPFCTWLALSHLAQGYQSAPQLNVGVHADHVAARLAWDASQVGFARFEFRARHGGLGARLAEVAAAGDLRFRVYAAAPWPEGSRLVFESPTEWAHSFDETSRRGVWWELGRRWELPASMDLAASPEFGRAVLEVFRALLPVFDRVDA